MIVANITHSIAKSFQGDRQHGDVEVILIFSLQCLKLKEKTKRRTE